jgi:hypothetical protein
MHCWLTTEMLPESAWKSTNTFGTTLLVASRTNAVIVAEFEPFDGICGRW